MRENFDFQESVTGIRNETSWNFKNKSNQDP